MIDRLQDMLPYLEQLPPEAQEEAAAYIEALTESLERTSRLHGHAPARELEEQWQDPAGAWRDLPDDMLEELDQLRHANPPTPPLEYL